MPIDALFSIIIILLCLGLLIFTKISPDVILMGGLTLLVTAGVINLGTGLSGFANEGFLTVGIMFVIAAGLRDTGALDFVTQKIFGRTKSIQVGLARVVIPTISLSAFLNNTPLVAAFIPAVSDWAKKNRFSVSKFMIPLSYASILGGTLTLIGTSTNIIVYGLLKTQKNIDLSFFDIAYIGLPIAIAGSVYLIIFGNKLLPERKSALENLINIKEYTVEMLVSPGGPLINKKIEEAGLYNLPGLTLLEIDRDGLKISEINPDISLLENDRLIFTGATESVVDLQKTKGLTPATNQIFKLTSPRPNRGLIEAVISGRNPLVGKTVREGKFRSVYDAAIIGIARDGKRIDKKIGDIKLFPGDTLLLEAHSSFLAQHRNSRDFLLLRKVEDSAPIRHEKSLIAWTILLLMVLAATLEIMSILNAAMLAAGLMIITKCVSAATARRSIEIQVLLVIAASIGIGKSLEVTGAASFIATKFLGILGSNPLLILAGIYIMTNILTEVITNNAAAVLMFPIADSVSQTMDLNFMPFVFAIMIASSAGYSTPIGYQTHLMVYGPGGYLYKDYLKIGLPLNILNFIICLIIIPIKWPLT